jgi:hypothetical protein
MLEFTVVHYVASDGLAPFEAWFQSLGHMEAAKVVVALGRLAAGNSAARNAWRDYWRRRPDVQPQEE